MLSQCKSSAGTVQTLLSFAGSPVRSQLTKDFSYITVRDDDLVKARVRGTRQVERRSPIPPTILSPLGEAPGPPDAVYQAEDDSQKANQNEFKSDLEKENLQGTRQIHGQSPILLDTSSPLEEFSGPPDAVKEAEDDSQQTNPDEIKSDLGIGNMQGTQQVQGRSPILLDTSSPLEESPSPPDAVYQGDDGSQETSPEEIKSDLEKVKMQTTWEAPKWPPMEEDINSVNAADQVEDEYQGTPEQGKSDLVKVRIRRRKQIPLQEETTDPPDANEYQAIQENVEPEEASEVQTSTRGNEEENLRMSIQQEQFPQRGTSTIPEANTDESPEMMSSSGIRWNVAHLQNKDDNKRYKVKKKNKQYSRAEDPAKSGSPLIVAGVAAGILVLLSFVAYFVWLW